MNKKRFSKVIIFSFFTLFLLLVIKDIKNYKTTDAAFNENHLAETLIYKSTNSLEKSFSERKKKIKGIVGKDNPNLFAKFHNDIRTRYGELGPKYSLNYKVKELLKAKSIKSTGALHKISNDKILGWIERGPGNVSGRTRGLIVDPDDPTNNTWFAGSVGGGVWKTENAGQSWMELTETLPNLATSTLAMAASNHNVIYVGTGEGFYNIDQINGNGMWKTTDRGVTWEQLENTTNNPEFQNIMRIIVDPADENVLLIATVPGFWYPQDESPNSCLFRSTDGGETWTKVYESSEGDVQQVISNPQNFKTQYATIKGKGVIKSIDSGKTWKNSSKGVTRGGRMEMAISPTDTSRLYISAESNTSILYVSVDAGATWSQGEEIRGKDVDWLGTQGWYDNSIAVHPYNQDIVFVGGIDLWKHELIPGRDTTFFQITGVDFENTRSFFALLYFAGEFANGVIGAGTVSLDEYTSVELRFGAEKSQKAHRFTVPSGSSSDIDAAPANFIFQDYVNVPFELWDINNNVQLMLSFYDHLKDGEFELQAFNLDSSREYIYMHAIPYQTTPSNEIAQIGGQTHKQLFHLWPFLMPRATWHPENLPEATLRINCEKNIIKRFVTTNVTDGYRQYGGSSKGVHVDHHNIILIPVNEETKQFRFLNANDGGVSFSDDGGKTFRQPLNSYNTTQFYGVDKMNGANRYIGGTQDNGTWVSPDNADASSVWQPAPGGDGFETVWHYKNANKLLESSQYNYIYRSLDGGKNWKTVTYLSGMVDIDDDKAPFFTKIAKSKQYPDLIFVMGASGIWRSEDFASTWTLIAMPGGFDGTNSMSEVKISLARPHIVWAGTAMLPGNPLYVSTDEGFTFKETNVFSNNTLGSISGLETHPVDPNTAYVLFSFANAPKILRTTDLGKTWQDISGFGKNTSSSNGFPDVAVYSLLVMPFNPDIIWAGTEIGIFETTNSGASWHYADNGFPATLVYEMLIVNDQVVIATHGRGVWSVTLLELAGYEPPVATLLPKISQVSGGGAGIVSLNVQLRSAYDSSFVLVDENKFIKISGNKAALDTTISFVYPVEDETNLSISISSYKDGEAFYSRVVEITIFPLLEARDMYINDFEYQTSDFIINGFRIETSADGFSNGAIHSLHPYPNSKNLFVLLKYPIIVSSENSTLSYDDIAIVEPGALFSRFGDTNFKDYVVVEGSDNNGVSWLPLADGYDAFYNILQWFPAFRDGNPADSTMFKKHEIDISDVFAPGEEILIRFRLFADDGDSGWGWVIDNLSIQNDFTSVTTDETQTNQFVLAQNYPNPFNSNTTIKYSIPVKNEVTLKILNTLGQEIYSLIAQRQHLPGNYEIIWDGKNNSGNSVSSGVYFYSIQAGENIRTRKMLLLE